VHNEGPIFAGELRMISKRRSTENTRHLDKRPAWYLYCIVPYSKGIYGAALNVGGNTIGSIQRGASISATLIKGGQLTPRHFHSPHDQLSTFGGKLQSSLLNGGPRASSPPTIIQKGIPQRCQSCGLNNIRASGKEH